MNISSLSRAEELLLKYVPAVKQFTGKNVTLERMYPLLNALGNPQETYKVVHIAGTSGKTSTSYYIASLLAASGAKVGLTVSPHIDSVTERIQINGAPIADDLFCKYLGECLDIIKDLAVQPSYFELLVALAYWIFAKENVEYAVIETGMGGLQDGTNMVSRPGKVCVITDIGFDHMHILGNTITEIAAQKAGIIQQNNSVFMYKQSHDVMQQVLTRADTYSADVYVKSEADLMTDAGLDLSDLPDFQKRNFLLAKVVTDYILAKDNKGPSTPTSLKNAAYTYVPGRMDIVKVGYKTIVMDGAHNGQKVEVFVKSFMHKFPSTKVAILLALKEGKEYAEVVDALLPIAEHLILTTFATSQDLPAHAMNPSKLATYIKSKSRVSFEVIANSHDAYTALIARPEPVCLLVGSFYMLGQVRLSENLQHKY